MDNPTPPKINQNISRCPPSVDFQDRLDTSARSVQPCAKLLTALPAVILAIGFIFLIYLQASISTGVFYNGDCGLKALQTMQIASGNFRTSLELSGTQWEKELWAQGMYPFDAPFAYRVGDKYFVQYPYFFPLLSAPFYFVLGYHGFYLIPVLSAFLLWVCLLYAANRMRCHPLETSLLLLILIFASPVTLYSAILGEQTLALLLAFGGIVILLFPPSRITRGRSASLAGFLVGIASWFRPEMYCLGIAVIISMFLWKILQRTAVNPSRFLTSFSLSFLILILHNLIVFQSPFGVRSNEIMSGLAIAERLQVYRIVMSSLWNALAYFFPLIFVPVLLAVGIWINRERKLSGESLFCSLVIVLYVLTVPAIVPNFGGKQWPPRYFLILAPLTALLIGNMFLSLARKWRRIHSYLLAAAILGLTTWCIRVNTIEGYEYLSHEYAQRAAPPVDFLMRSPLHHVAVSNQYLSQEFAFAFSSKAFFMPRSQWHLWRLCETLSRRRCDKFMYLCYAFRKPPETVEFLSEKDKLEARFSLVHRFGDPNSMDKYSCILFYTVTLQRIPMTPPAPT